jgi:hypothetical protein
MTNGDTYGVWLVNDVNDTSLPMEVWKQRFAVEIAARPTLAVKDRGFKGASRLDLALADATRIAQNVGDVTVIIVSNGETPFSGTPFDDEINAATARIFPEMKRAKATVNTVLVAQEGKWVAWAVNSPEFLVVLPTVPPKPIRTPAAMATVKTNHLQHSATNTAKEAPAVAVVPPATPATPSSSNATAEITSTPATTRAAVSPIIITRETVEYDKTMMKALASTQFTNDQLVASLLPAPAPAVATPPPAPTNTPSTNNSAARLATTVSNAHPTETTLPTAGSSPAPATPPPAETLPPPAEDVNVSSGDQAPPLESDTDPAEVAGTPSRSASALPGVAPEGGTPLLWIAAGASCATVFLLVIALRRDRHDEVSLITRAAAMERVQGPPS